MLQDWTDYLDALRDSTGFSTEHGIMVHYQVELKIPYFVLDTAKTEHIWLYAKDGGKAHLPEFSDTFTIRFFSLQQHNTLTRKL